MAAASTVVDLSALADAELDAATLAKFFRDDDDDGAGGAIRSFSWPEAEKKTSKLSQGEVQNFCNKYVPPGYTPIPISSLDGWVACQTPPEGSICVYADALNAGMGIPLHPFCVTVLGHYGLAPSQLAPEAWGYMAAFLLLSKQVGVEPMLSAFLLLFSLCTHEGDSVGWYHFKSRPSPPSLSRGTSIRIFTGNMPPFPGWESKFFFLKPPSTTPWPCAVDWGKPSRAAVRNPVLSLQTSETKTVVRQLLDKAGPGIRVVGYLSSPPPLSVRAPRQKHNPVKAEADVDAAAGPLPPHQQEPAGRRKRKSFTQMDRWKLVAAPEKMSKLVGKAMAQLDETEKELEEKKKELEEMEKELEEKKKELQESKEKVTQLRQELTEATRKHADEVSQRAKEHAEQVKAVRAELHRELTKTLEEEHAMEKEMEDVIENMAHTLFPKLDAMLDASLL